MRYRAFIIILSIFFSNSCDQSAQSTLEKVQSLGLNKKKGDLTVYYPEGFKEVAEETVDLLQNSTEYFEETFQVSESFSLAVLDSSSWVKLGEIPYGLPFVSGPPYVVCIPATSKNVLARIIGEGLAGHDFKSSYDMTQDEVVNRFISLIGFHELGHIYANEYGMSFPNRWTFEFAATYFAYSYLEARQPMMSRLWVDVSYILLEKITPEHRSLSDFEELYVRAGVDNYAWYQMVFLKQVKEVYDIQGNDFLKFYRDHSWPAQSGDHYLGEMEEICGGFIEWAEKWGLVE